MNKHNTVSSGPTQLDLLSRVLAASKRTETLRYDASNTQQVYAVALYGRLLEHADGIRCLAATASTGSLPVVLRALIEVSAHLRNQIADPEYQDQMYREHLWQHRKLLEEARKHEYFEYLRSDPESLRKLEEVERELERSENAKAMRPSLARRFKEAGMAGVYVSLYWLLSEEAHSNLSSFSRQVSLETHQPRVILLPGLASEDLERYLHSTIAFTLAASAEIRRFLGTFAAAPWESLLEEHSSFPLESSVGF